MRKMYFSKACKNSFLLAFLLLGGYGINANATSTKYYKVVATASPTGAGKVYATDDGSDVPASSSYKEESSKTGSSTSSSQLVYLYAKPNEGYLFDSWSKDGTSVSTDSIFATTISFSSTENTNPTTTTFTANFIERGAAYVASSGLGTVSIDKPSNVVGDKVTITASEPSALLGKFLGWYGPDGSKVSSDLSYTFDVTDSNKGQYTARYEVKDLSKGVYVWIYNMYNNRPRIFGFNGTCGTAVIATGSRQYERCPIYAMETIDYFNLNAYLQYESSKYVVHTMPAFVFKLSGTNNGDGTVSDLKLEAQGITLDSILNNYGGWLASQHSELYELASDTANAKCRLRWVNTTNNPNSFLFEIGNASESVQKQFGVKSLVLSNASLTSTLPNIENVSTGWGPGFINETPATRDYATHDCNWKIAPLSEIYSTNGLDSLDYFGGMPTTSQKIGDRYYTTKYAPFPFKCLDGVKAYTVKGIDANDTLQLEVIANDTVPARTPVILACKTAHAKTNRLLPLVDEVPALNRTNLLKGELYLIDSNTEEPNRYRTAFNPNTMRVLSTTSGRFEAHNNKGYYVEYPADRSATTKAVNDTLLPYIVNNTAYLDVSSVKGANTIIYLPGDEGSNVNAKAVKKSPISSGINSIDKSVRSDDARIYNTNGQFVGTDKSTLPKGVYISRGKKFTK